MGSWEVQGKVKGMGKSWRDKYPELGARVGRVTAPHGRGIIWEGSEIWAYKDRAQSVSEVLRANIEKRPDQEAYVFYPGGRRMTWRETGLEAGNMAYSLRHEYGFQKGDRLCLMMLGCPEFIVSYFAVTSLGGIAAPVNLSLAPDGIASQLNKIKTKGIVASPEIFEAKIKPVLDQLNTIEFIVVTSNEEIEGAVPFASLTDTPAGEEVSEEIDEWDLCAISFTSGTTGVPKATMAMHINVLGCGQCLIDCLKLTSEDSILCMAPLFHNTALYANFIPALFAGAKLVVMSSFDPLEAIKIADKEKITACVAAPIMFLFMMNHPEFKKYDLSSLKSIGFGGHAASEAFIRQLMDSFSLKAAINGGAVSESTALGFALPMEDQIRKITSCGLATPNTEIALFDENGHEVTEPNEIGEVAYKGQQTNAGYWEEPEKTRETFRADGYVLSGDWAKIDEEGYLWLLDRKKDMVVRGGQNVYCIEVENKIFLNDKVLRTAVVGVPDHLFSERLKAVVVPMPGASITADEIREHCKKHLTHYEIPEYVVFAPAIPTNPAGKTLKPALRDFWGESPDAEDAAMAKLKGYCRSLPDKLLDRELFHFDGAVISPGEAMRHAEAGDEPGKKLLEIISDKGVVELLKPSEARFRNTD